MRRIVLFACSISVVAGLLVASGAEAQLPRRGSAGKEAEPSQCMGETRIEITANPAAVTYGQSTTVSWNVAIPSGCSTLRMRLNGEAVAKSGSRTVTPPRSARYTISVSETRNGVSAQRNQSTHVQVDYSSRVVIDSRTLDPVAVLLGALIDSTNAQQVVELCDVDLDLTGVSGIVIGDGRSLIASPACARGPRQFGPRLFVTDKRGNLPLFVIRGDNIRFSGFRLEGPTSEIGQGNVKEKGILVWPFDRPFPMHDIEISNMEIYHWSGTGVQIRDNVESAERGRLFNTNPGAVRVSGNYFHHNRHGAGEGYGIVSSGGAYVLIEQNVFDENRHAIAGGSRTEDALDYSGYTARDNLVLSGGGKHCSEHWGWALLGWRFNCFQTHQIDMHGDQNAFYSSSNWQCGTAGETMIIERNTVLYTSGIGVKIRGNPADKAVLDGNVFRSARSNAIAQNGGCGFGDNITKPIDVQPSNAFSVDDPMAVLGSCDFAGDGQQDQFMATGVTWWAKSPVTQQWRYLNTMPEKLPQLQLRRIDSDAVCDVAPRFVQSETAQVSLPKKYSKSGTSPWKPPLLVSPF